eukprot:COSAG01_NODE_9027_length_2578_cov_2.103267_3_plen_71_part_00
MGALTAEGEVAQLDSELLVVQHVVALEVPVANVVLVKVAHALDDAVRDRQQPVVGHLLLVLAVGGDGALA